MAENTDKKAAIGELLNGADENSKKVISSYNFSASYKVNLSSLKSYNATVLEDCAVFLGFTPRCQQNKKLYKNLTTLSDRIILRIESMFEIHCDECDSMYRNKRTDEPPLNCQLCLQGCHNCTGMLEKITAYEKLCSDGNCPAGIVWMCHECKKKNDLTLAPQTKPAQTVANTATSAAREHPTIEEEKEEEDQDDRESPRRGREHQDRPTQPSLSNLCEAYKKMKCPHGLTGKRLIEGKRCPKDHVPRCRRYCRFGDKQRQGCKFGEKCRYYHPKLCRNSVSKQVCLNPDCTYVHLKFTRRHEDGKPRPNRDHADRFPQRDHPPPNRDHQQNREGVGYRDPPIKTRLNNRFASSGSIYTAPYPATIDNRPQRKARFDSQSERDPKDSSAFLEKLLENMKDGIMLQMENKLLELRNDIPTMIQDLPQLKLQETGMIRPQSQPPLLPQLPFNQHQPPFPLNMMYQTNKAMQQPHTMQMPSNCQNFSY